MQTMMRLVDAKLLYEYTDGVYGISQKEYEEKVKLAGKDWKSTRILVEVPD